MKDELYTYEEAANVLHVSRSTLFRAIADEKLHPIKLKGDAKKYLKKEEVNFYIGRKLGATHIIINPTPSVDTRDTENKHIEAPIPLAPISLFSISELEQYSRAGKKIIAEPVGHNKYAFQLALTDENIGIPLLSLVLLGLALLYIYHVTKHKDLEKALLETGKVLDKMNIKLLEILDNPSEGMELLKNHPEEVQKLKEILEQENLLAA